MIVEEEQADAAEAAVSAAESGMGCLMHYFLRLIDPRDG
jgi:hypothetical protein